MGLKENVHYLMEKYDITLKWISEETKILEVESIVKTENPICSYEINRIAEYLCVSVDWILSDNDLSKEYNFVEENKKYFKLDPVVKKKRTCLLCGYKFSSTGVENRLCKYCNRRNKKMNFADTNNVEFHGKLDESIRKNGLI